jgi:hypothetical protein
MMALVSDGQPFSLFWPSHTQVRIQCCFLRIIDVVCVSNELRYAMLVGIKYFYISPAECQLVMRASGQ